MVTLYERFWRDEYHYVLFPLYGKTVKKGTTTRNYLYPFFSTISGEKEAWLSVLAAVWTVCEGRGLQQALFSVAVFYAGKERTRYQ